MQKRRWNEIENIVELCRIGSDLLVLLQVSPDPQAKPQGTRRTCCAARQFSPAAGVCGRAGTFFIRKDFPEMAGLQPPKLLLYESFIWLVVYLPT